MKSQRNNGNHNNHHQHETWICTVCKRCLTELKPLYDDNGEIYLYECLCCGETYVVQELIHTQKTI